MFELKVLQRVCNKINSRDSSFNQEYFDSELEKLYPSLADISLSEELISNSEVFKVIGNYLNNTIDQKLSHLSNYASFYDAETYGKANELYDKWFNKSLDKITNNLFKEEIDVSVDPETRKLLLIQIEYIYNSIFMNISFVVKYIETFLKSNNDILRFIYTQYCDSIIKLIDWQISSENNTKVWAYFFSKHLFYNARKYKWLYFLCYYLQLNPWRDHRRKFSDAIFSSTLSYVEDESINVEYNLYYHTGVDYICDELTKTFGESYDTNYFLWHDSIATAFMSTIKFNERININNACASIIIYSVIGYYCLHLDDNKNFLADLNVITENIIQNALKIKIGTYDFSSLYESVRADSDYFEEVSNDVVSKYIEKLKSQDYLQSEFMAFNEKFYQGLLTPNTETLLQVVNSFETKNLGSIKIFKDINYKDAILYTLIYVHDSKRCYRIIENPLFDKTTSLINNKSLCDYVGKETIAKLPEYTLVDNNLLDMSSIKEFNVAEYKGDLYYSIIIDWLILNNMLIYKTNYSVLKSASFQESIIKHWNLEKLIQSNGLVLINKKPYSVADYFEVILCFYLEANGFEKALDFVYDLIKDFDPELCTNGIPNMIPKDNLSNMLNTIKFNIDKLSASQESKINYLEGGSKAREVLYKRKHYLYADIKKIVENYMSNNIDKKK